MLCNMTLNGLNDSMQKISLNLGNDYEVVAVSFDPRETPPLAKAKKGNYLEKYNRRAPPKAGIS